jgi:hypothetical protein
MLFPFSITNLCPLRPGGYKKVFFGLLDFLLDITGIRAVDRALVCFGEMSGATLLPGLLIPFLPPEGRHQELSLPGGKAFPQCDQ